MKSPVEHLLMSLWAAERDGETHDAALHGRPDASAEGAGAAYAEAEQSGLVVNREGERRLSAKGEAVARMLLRRHRLAERLLSDILELPEAEFEESACRFEHYLSEPATERICTLLGHPTTCPHGRVIPPGECCRARLRIVEPIVERLTNLSPGDQARIVFVTPAAGKSLERLQTLGASPGSVIQLRQKVPSFVILAGQTEIALEEPVAAEIFVSRQVSTSPAGGRRRWRLRMGGAGR